ncbi:unnamed protein product [Moneuplotes crassus]|uniref:Uncharacterized protein n=1 Tax=Euplotes crassus TaxID=5936 RepID=A0A7S3KU38_EUPCR|nr:unnamed protein product [Moneuplotes crassus]|mmetsp:Transcript_8660/g.8175  ORF Transcript_8660/g.8175 Transcript_8660/m.8175 type:complete len:155 (+) Transcript_8660:1-465(+)
MAQKGNSGRENWKNDAEYEGYEWMEPMSHKGFPMWQDSTLYDETYNETFTETFYESRYEPYGPYGPRGPIREYGVIQEHLEPVYTAPQWVNNSQPVEYTPDPGTPPPPKKTVSPLWVPKPPKVRQPLKPVYDTHYADTAGREQDPAGTWYPKRW